MSTTIICILLIVVVIFGIKSCAKRASSGCCGASSQKPVGKVRVKDRDISHYPCHKILKIDGMSCGNCAARVENALNVLDGMWARVDLMKGEADVYMKQELKDETLKDAVKEAGYTVYQIKEVDCE